MRALPSPLLVVTDRHQAARSLEQVVEKALAAGARWIWLRDRDLEAGERRALAVSLGALVRARGGSLSIGADTELAAEVAADGVHLPFGSDVAAARRRLGEAALIGVSAHALSDVQTAAAAGVDYATLSPIFASASKPGYGPALGLEAIHAAAGAGIPILALGGVTAANAGDCLAAGARGVAMMGEIMRAEALPASIKEILAIAHAR